MSALLNIVPVPGPVRVDVPVLIFFKHSGLHLPSLGEGAGQADQRQS